MAPRASTLIIVLSTMLFSTTTISAFNITRLLEQHPDFSTFNNLLTQTGVAAEINKRRTITVLVVDNSGMGQISGKPQSTIKSILETHVLLDYYDTTKLPDVDTTGAISVNLFQTSGVANKQQGQINITNSGGQVVFGSAMKGAQYESKMVKSIAAQPFNISVIQITSPINTPGLDQTAPSAPTGSPMASPPTPVAAPPPKTNSTEVPAPSADAPADNEAADGPDSEGPAAASNPSPSPAPEGDEADKETPAKATPSPKNGAKQATVGGAVVTAFMGLLVLSL